MSREDDDERQYQCFRKYEEIVKQIDSSLQLTLKSICRRKRLAFRCTMDAKHGYAKGRSVRDCRSISLIYVKYLFVFSITRARGGTTAPLHRGKELAATTCLFKQ
ncbi:hypothetical protein H6P81_011726 [Aristolochia fimbriata]|uniref:Uncharacterized protein n=1 Tax=Aristolochia fimbriata TaxID=158543 RepID=A0AAV7E9Y3_ARIFI|nr:hypothetical protein H6P81_011726 [Aristolochia fimbriata]